MNCLVELPVGELLEKGSNVFWPAPVLDEVELLDDPTKLVHRGVVARVPALLGFTRDEGAGTQFSANMTENEFQQVLRANGVSEESLPKVQGVYAASQREWYYMAVSFTTNHGIGCRARNFAHALSDAG